MSSKITKISIVTPIYNEEDNLQALFSEIKNMVEKQQGFNWEWVAVDDHSSDMSRQILRDLSSQNEQVRYLRLSKNYGSHIAIAAGIAHASGDCIAVIASDLQDDPNEIERLIRHWQDGYQIVWLTRRLSGDYSPDAFGRIWYWIIRHLQGLENTPATGSDAFLIDKTVSQALQKNNVRNVSIPLLIRSLGFRQINLEYNKKFRIAGTSNWSMTKKFLHVFNTLLTFSNFPARALSIIGTVTSLISLFFSFYIVIHRLVLNKSVLGWHSTMFIGSLAFSLIMIIVTIQNEYLWRIFENSRDTPSFIIEETSADL